MSQGFYGFPNILGLLRATSLRVLGKPGASAGGGLAGATASGAPSSGQFDVGEAVIAQDGHLWICTASGSPGTWADAGTAGSTLAIEHGGSAIATRPTLNLIDGSNVTLTVADNSGSNRVDATVAAAGGSAPSVSWATKTGAYTLTTSDTGILADATSGAFTLTLPTAVGATARYSIKKKDSSSNAVTLATTSSQTIDGATTLTLSSPGSTLDLIGDGSNWYGAGGPRGQIGYASGTTQVTTTSTSSVDVSGLSVSVTVGARPLRITAYCDYFGNQTASNRSEISIYDVTASAQVTRGIALDVGTNSMALVVHARVAPAAGSRTYKVQYRSFDAGTTIFGSGSASAPYFLLVEEL